MCVSAVCFHSVRDILSPLQGRVCVWQMARATHANTHYHRLTIPEGLIIGPPPVGLLPLRGIHSLTQHAFAGLHSVFVCVSVCVFFTCHAEMSRVGQLFPSLKLYLHFY